MNAVFNKVVVTMLSKYLQYYMNDFSRESFKLQIMKGTFDLEDMEINCQFLKDTVVLPNLEITDCLCNKLYLYIPWSNLGTEPITFDLDTINMTLVEIPPGEKGQFEVKAKRVKPTTYGFVQRTIDGIKMTVKSVNITMKLNGYRSNPSITKIKTDNIKIYSCGPDWRPVDLKESFVADKKKSEVLFYKILECGSLEFSFADLSPDRKNADEPPEYNVIMRDVPVKIRCKVLKDIHDGHVICGAFDLVLENMEMSFSDWQWKAFLELIKSLISCFTRTDQEYIFYKDIGKAFQDEDSDDEGDGGKKERVQKQPPKAKSWFGGWGESARAKKEQKDKERADKDKQKRMDEWGARSKAREDALAAGASADELDLEETTFNIYIDKGCLNMLNDEDANCDDPAFKAFGRLHFEDMSAVFTLPPSMDVPVANKWTDSDPKRKLLCEAMLEMKHMALVLQERIEKGKKSQERNQVVLVTDGRSESLKVKASKHTKKKKKKEKKKKAKKDRKKGDEGESKKKKKPAKVIGAKDKKMIPFSLCKWEVVTTAPQELDMAKWLKSLDAQMKINVYESHLLMLHQWWARIERYLETASAGGKNIEALSLMKVTVALHVVGNWMTIPLTMSNQLVVPTMEEILAAPHLLLFSTKLSASKKALDKATKALFDSVKIKESFVGEAKDKMIKNEGEKEVSKLKDVTIVGFGDHKNGWTDQDLLRKPQRFECLFENMSLTIGDRKILNPIDFEFELALHRYETTEQLLLELCARAQVLQLHLSRSEYLMFVHFMEDVINSVWMEIILVLQRKYGPDRFQKKLSEMTYHDLAVSENKMPIVVNSYGFVDYMIVSVNKEKTLHDTVFFADEKEPPKDEGILAELHFVDMRSKSCNTNQHKTGFYEKSVTCSKLKVLTPPEGGSKLEGYPLNMASSGEKESDTKVVLGEIEGHVFSSELPLVQSILKEANQKALTSLRGGEDFQGESNRGVGAGSSFIKAEKFELVVDGENQKGVPGTLVSFVNDMLNI